MAALREAGLTGADRGRARPGQRLHPRPDRLPRALRRADRLGDGHPQPVRALARRALPRGGRAQRRPGDHPGRRLRRPLLGRPASRAWSWPQGDHRAFRPDGWIEAGLEKLERVLPDRRARRADADPARLPVEPRPPGGRVRRPDPDPGGRRRMPARSRRSAPSWRRCPPSSASAPTTSPRSARSATTPAAWR